MVEKNKIIQITAKYFYVALRVMNAIIVTGLIKYFPCAKKYILVVKRLKLVHYLCNELRVTNVITVIGKVECFFCSDAGLL